MKILLKQLDLERQKITEWREGFIELEKDHFRYFIDFTADEPDPDDSMPWKKDVINYFDVICYKDKIHAIEVCYLGTDNIYRVMLISSDFTIKLYYKTKIKTIDVYKKLVKWKFPLVNTNKINFKTSN